MDTSNFKEVFESPKVKTLTAQVAALELEVVRLRNALETFIAEHEECEDGDGWMAQMCSMEALHAADEAISSPTSTEALDAYVAEKIKELQNELERERMRLAACGTAALGYFEECRDEYKSASLDDTLRLYAKAERIIRQRDLAVSAMEAALKENRIVPMFKALAAIKESEATK